MTRGSQFVLVALLAFALAVASGPSATAEHTLHHRYFITGTVTDELGRPLCGVTVRAADLTSPNGDGSDNRTATTDGSGVYTIQLHMHDGDAADGAVPSEVNAHIHVSIDGTSVSEAHFATPNGGHPDGWGLQTVPLTAPSGVQDRCGLGALLVPLGIVLAVALAVIAAVWMRRRPRGRGSGSMKALLAVPGVTRARARELGSFGIRSVKDLGEADPEELSKKTNLTAKESRLLVKRAQEFVGQREG